MSDQSVLVLSAPITVVNGTAVVAGRIQIDLGALEIEGGEFVALIVAAPGAQLNVSSDTVVDARVQAIGLRECERTTSRAEHRGNTFGVLFDVEDSGCGKRHENTPLVIGLVTGGVALLACVSVCVVVVAGMVWWRRLGPTLWQKSTLQSDLDQVVH